MRYKLCIWICLALSCAGPLTADTGWNADSIDRWIDRSLTEYHILTRQYESRKIALLERSQHLQAQLLAPVFRSPRKWQNLYREKFRIDQAIEQLEREQEMQLLKIRYKKGIDLIKLLYEKVLALDHHFSSMQIYQNILLLSNPNTYPDFQRTRELLEEQLKKRNALQLPNILHSNPYLSATFSLLATFIGDGEPNERQQEFERISCILDFTVRMGAELSIIQHETEYLRTANQSLRAECERLFEDYVKVVGYIVPLEKCRISDDWEAVYLHLEDFVHQLEAGVGSVRWTREQINLEFATQRVAEFISQYQLFVSQGTQYYQKFDNIISTYENEAVCKQALPRQFEELRGDIRQTIDKFSHTYNLPEIQGSRMKDLLFGAVE